MDFSISVMPLDPLFKPDEDARARAVAVMTEYFPEEDHSWPIDTHSFPAPRFFCSYQELSAFTCPSCGAETNDKEEGWMERLEAAQDAPDAFMHKTHLPCCNTVVSFKDIRFKEDRWGPKAHFASFRVHLEEVDPDIIDDIFKDRIEKALGCEVLVMISGET